MKQDNPVSIRTVYCIVWTDPPEVSDFEPVTSQGIIIRFTSPDAQQLLDGISVYRTISHARRTARKRPPWLGRGFLARIEIPGHADFRMERTTRSAGHYTLWADAASIMSWVTAVSPVNESKDAHDGV